MNASTERVDPALAAGNRKQLAGYRATHFLWEVKDGVATVTLNRPERKNPLTFDSYAELRDFFGQHLKYATDVKAVVVTGAGAHAVHRRDDRLRAGAHGPDQVAGHAGKAKQAGLVHFRKRADDLVNVAAGTEVAARAGDDDGLDVAAIIELPEGRA